MDGLDISEAELLEDLRNLSFLNRYFGGHSATKFIADRCQHLRKPLLLDCACGAADLTAILSRELDGPVLASDFHPLTIRLARRSLPASHVFWSQLDARYLPFAEASFDAVVCQLTLHHFSRAEAITVLRELRRVSRGPVFVTDLVRSDLSYLGLLCLVHTWLRAPMTRHDALLSARRAFSKGELCELCREAGWHRFQHRRLPWFRQVVWCD
jgi:2-polyprenyl-3-methyl-5-hydroxy-6-metoxy-1,4-benzoquinol methylase